MNIVSYFCINMWSFTQSCVLPSFLIVDNNIIYIEIKEKSPVDLLDRAFYGGLKELRIYRNVFRRCLGKVRYSSDLRSHCITTRYKVLMHQCILHSLCSHVHSVFSCAVPPLCCLGCGYFLVQVYYSIFELKIRVFILKNKVVPMEKHYLMSTSKLVKTILYHNLNLHGQIIYISCTEFNIANCFP